MCTPGIKMSVTISRLNSSVEECFSSQSLKSHPDNTSRIKTGLQGCKYLEIAVSILPQGYPILPPQILYKRLRDCKKHSHDMGANEITYYSPTPVENKFKVFFSFLKTLFWLESINRNNCKWFFISHCIN